MINIFLSLSLLLILFSANAQQSSLITDTLPQNTIYLDPALYNFHMLPMEDVGKMKKTIVNPVFKEVYDLPAHNNITMTPNPCGKDKTLMINSEVPIQEISVLNIVGDEIYCQTVNSNSAELNHSLNNGLYFVKIKTENKITTRKLIVD